MRIIVAIPMVFLSLLFSLGLFDLMQLLVENHGSKKIDSETIRCIDFVRLVPKKEKDIERPKAPQKPPSLQPPPPEMDISIKSPKKPRLAKLELPKAKLDIPLQINSPKLLSAFTHSKRAKAKSNNEIVPLVKIAPIYPYRARRDGIEGWVELEFTICRNGRVKNIEIVESNPRRFFDRAAKRSLSKWRFKPKIVNGIAVKRRARQRLNFRLDQ